jgi:hypothetical protein
MYFIIYKTTNLVNGKIYIGAHQTKKLNDGYIGSGYLLRYAIKKYGKDSFSCEVLYHFTDRQQMMEKEKEIVNEEFIIQKSNYNIRVGGQGGFDHYDRYSETSIQKRVIGISRFYEQHPEAREKARIRLESYYNKFKEASIGYHKTHPGTFTGKKHKEESVLKLKETLKKTCHQQGIKNSQYGTCWIYNIITNCNKKIKKQDYYLYETDNWIKGRK